MVKSKIKLTIPTWATLVYIAMSIVLIPWTIYLGTSLPVHYLSAHWDISWIGLDAAMVIAMLITGILAYFKSIWVVITSSVVGTLMFVDAWFDVISERRAIELHEAFFLAIFFELPIAITSFYLAYKVINSEKP